MPPGRKKGTPKKRTVEIQNRLETLGCDPIEGMATIAVDEEQPAALRGKMYAKLLRHLDLKRDYQVIPYDAVLGKHRTNF